MFKIYKTTVYPEFISTFYINVKNNLQILTALRRVSLTLRNITTGFPTIVVKLKRPTILSLQPIDVMHKLGLRRLRENVTEIEMVGIRHGQWRLEREEHVMTLATRRPTSCPTNDRRTSPLFKNIAVKIALSVSDWRWHLIQLRCKQCERLVVVVNNFSWRLCYHFPFTF